jgi:hypothetical protein
MKGNGALNGSKGRILAEKRGFEANARDIGGHGTGVTPV